MKTAATYTEPAPMSAAPKTSRAVGATAVSNASMPLSSSERRRDDRAERER
jgi:hypothetical protein